MKKYDDLVVGSGISGLTATLLLAMSGHKVLLLEKAPRIGGSLARYSRQGIPFDTGFHFTGGFAGNRLLHDMLTALGIRDAISPVFLHGEGANQFCLAPSGRTFELPCGMAAVRARFKDYFPGERSAVDRYFDRVQSVCDRTSTMDVSRLSVSPDVLDEDFVSVQQVLDGLTADPELKALLSGFAMCYGTPPAEMSFANHSRICQGLYESVARVENGGEAFVRAFAQRFRQYDVDVLCGRHIVECVDEGGAFIERARLDDGGEIAFRTAVFTIHPKEILRRLPRGRLSPAFVERVSAFENSAGFFALSGVCDPAAAEPDFGSTITSLFPSLDVNAMLAPRGDEDSALVVIKSLERVNGIVRHVLSAFEPSAPECVARWADTTTGRRPADYAAYKAGRTERLRRRILQHYPAYGGHFRVLDSASVLTFRDYLNSPDGCAYGIKQKIGQFNLFGKLPVRNFYAAGQSSVLPGLVGAMMSAFIVNRAILGRNAFGRLIGEACP